MRRRFETRNIVSIPAPTIRAQTLIRPILNGREANDAARNILVIVFATTARKMEVPATIIDTCPFFASDVIDTLIASTSVNQATKETIYLS